jgi:hypothetical protein
MAKRSQKQKDADELAKEQQTYSTRNEEAGKVGNVVDIRYPDSGANLARNPAAAQPTVAPTSQDDNSDSKEPTKDYENGFVDGPGGSGTADSAQTDAIRDASPEQRPKLVKVNPPQDT